MPIQLAVIFGALFFLSGCATIVNGDTVPINVQAKEPGTHVKANGQTFTVPVVLQLPRGRGPQDLVFVKEGEEERAVTLKETGSAWVFGNVIFMLLGIIFIGIDAANPHGYTLTPDDVLFSFRDPNGLVDPNPKQSTAFDGP